MIYDVDTMPMPIIWSNRILLPTLRQIRERCQLSIVQVALVAEVRPSVVFWMEQGIAVERGAVFNVLSVLSRWSGRYYSLYNVRGIRIKPQIPRCWQHFPRW